MPGGESQKPSTVRIEESAATVKRNVFDGAQHSSRIGTRYRSPAGIPNGATRSSANTPAVNIRLSTGTTNCLAGLVPMASSGTIICFKTGLILLQTIGLKSSRCQTDWKETLGRRLVQKQGARRTSINHSE